MINVVFRHGRTIMYVEIIHFHLWRRVEVLSIKRFRKRNLVIQRKIFPRTFLHSNAKNKISNNLRKKLNVPKRSFSRDKISSNFANSARKKIAFRFQPLSRNVFYCVLPLWFITSLAGAQSPSSHRRGSLIRCTDKNLIFLDTPKL